MARPFEIHADSIAKRPLSLEQTAEKYGASSTELSRIRTFIRSITGADASQNVRMPKRRTPSTKPRSTKARTKHK